MLRTGSIVIGGKEYPLRYSHAALALWEKYTGLSFSELCTFMGGGRVSVNVVCGLLRAGLNGARRKQDIRERKKLAWTEEEVFELLDEAGDLVTVLNGCAAVLNKARAKGTPAEDPEGAGGKESPPPGSDGKKTQPAPE